MHLLPTLNIRRLYDSFDSPLLSLDCGEKCRVHNPNNKPFCCDICHAIPAVYIQEWEYLPENTDLWHVWRGDECPGDDTDPGKLRAETPDHMLLLACNGPAYCQREFRAISCRQFPFFPYITSELRFLGLAYDWEFEPTCWVISNLEQVSDDFRKEFVRTFDRLFSQWDEEFEGYIFRSEDMREYFAGQKRNIPILLRGGGYVLVDPISERTRRISPGELEKFGPYAAGSEPAKTD